MIEVGPVAHGHRLDAGRVGSVPGFGALLAVRPLERSGVADDDPPTRGAAPASLLHRYDGLPRVLKKRPGWLSY
jgi:hypothetical protein